MIDWVVGEKRVGDDVRSTYAQAQLAVPTGCVLLTVISPDCAGRLAGCVWVVGVCVGGSGWLGLGLHVFMCEWESGEIWEFEVEFADGLVGAGWWLLGVCFVIGCLCLCLRVGVRLGAEVQRKGQAGGQKKKSGKFWWRWGSNQRLLLSCPDSQPIRLSCLRWVTE